MSMQELLDRGIKAVPVTIAGAEVVIGFNPKELARVFGLNPEVAQVDLPTMVDKYQTVLVAACRAARQVPPERAEWESPERQRTIRQFTFHLMDRPERALNAYHVRRYTNEDRGREVDDVIGAAGFEEIAQYGEGVLAQVKSALRPMPYLGRRVTCLSGLGRAGSWAAAPPEARVGIGPG